MQDYQELIRRVFFSGAGVPGIQVVQAPRRRRRSQDPLLTDDIETPLNDVVDNVTLVKKSEKLE